jgi:hypothetical protein
MDSKAASNISPSHPVSSQSMKHISRKKKRASRLWPQKRLVQFADLFNTIFQLVVVLQPFFDQFLLLGPQTDVSNLVTRGSHGQDQNRVAFPARALRTPLLMPNRSLQQRTAQKFASGQRGG